MQIMKKCKSTKDKLWRHFSVIDPFNFGAMPLPNAKWWSPSQGLGVG